MKTWRSIVKTARTVMSSRLFVCLMALCLAVNTIPTASVAEALEGVTGEPAAGEVVLTDEAAGEEAAADPAEQPTPEPEERPAAEPADEVAPPTDEAAPVEETAAPVQQAPEEGAAPAEEAAPASAGTLTAKSGKATVTASFGEGTFEGPVTLHVEEIVPGDARFSQVEGSLDELAETRDDYSYSHARAFDIWFENEAGDIVEPSKDVSVSIDLGEPVSENAISTDVVHIPDNGEAELVADANVAADGSAAAFESDAFSVYVVTAQIDGCVVVGDAYYTTLAEALENASDGDTINIIGTTADTDNVTVTKPVTILSDGEDGELPFTYLFIDAEGVTLGGGSNTLTAKRVWLGYNNGEYDAAASLTLKDGAVIKSNYYPLYFTNDDCTAKIEGGEITHTAPTSDKYAVTFYGGKITEISGGTINGGINNYWGTIESISGGTIQGNESGITMDHGTIGTITGGTISGSKYGVYLADGDSSIGSISGGVFIGNDALFAGDELSDSLPISDGVFKATGGYAVSPDVKADFTDGVEAVRFIGKLDDGTYTVPDGYAPSTDTVPVDGVEGDFHYFAHQYTITYDGNGGKTEDNKTTIEYKTTGAFEAAECDFVGPDSKVFKEWNTAADGSGDSYAEGAEVTPSDGMKLFAIWETPDGPVSIGDVEYPNIRAAVAAAQDGDVIKVNKNCADTAEPINVDKNVTIVAGNPGVKSTGANLKVVDGKKLTLGDGNADNVLRMTGTVDVNEGSLEFNDGIDLRNTITVWGESSTAAIKGGKIAAKSFAIEVRDGATVTEISGGELSSTNAAALFIRKGVVERISGENTSFTADNDSAVVIWQEGKIETIDNGRFISKKRSGYAAGLYVEGTVDTINDGFFEGYLGLQISGEERDATSPTTTKILGGEFYGKGGGRGNAINLGQIDGNNPRTYVVKNVTAVADTDFAILVGHNNIVEEMSGVEASGAWGGLRFFNMSNKSITVGTISDSTFTYTGDDPYDYALEMGRDVHVEKIVNTTFDGGVAGGAQLGSWVGNESTIGTIENCQFLGGSNRATGVSNNASIGTITGTKITGRFALDNGSGDYGKIGTLGEGNEFTGRFSGIHNATIINNIVAGTYSGAVGIDNEGSITSISGPVDVTGTDGPAVQSADSATITTISGAGVYKGTDNAIQINNATDKTNLEPGITAVRGDGRYKTSSNTVDSEFNSNTNIVLPDGYHVSKQTTSVSGQEGSFRYLVRDNTIIYRCNGEGHETEAGDAEVFKAYENATTAVEGNDTIKFAVNGLEFIGWNTAADGSGDSYKAGDNVTIPANEEVVLYAQWGVKITYKSADTTMGTVARNDEATQKVDGDDVTEVIAPNEAVATAFGLSTTPKGATASSVDTDKYQFVNWTDADGAEVGTDASYAPSTAPTKNATYTANFTKLWDVTFDEDGGTPVAEDLKVVDGETATKPATDPSKEGFTFKDWRKLVEGVLSDSPFDFATEIHEDTFLKAKYDEHTYTIAFDKNAGDATGETASMTGVKYTEKKALTENGFSRAGYDFADWNSAADGTDTAYADKAEVDKLTAEDGATVTLYAQWTARTDTPYVVKHLQQNVDNDEFTEVEADRENLTGTTDAEVTPDVKTYAGFTSPATQTVKIKGDGTTVVEYKYTRNTVTATFDANGGETANPATVAKKYGEALGELPQTSRTGYTFDGWYTAAEGGDMISPETTMPAKAVTYYAHWTANQYKVHFNANATSGQQATGTMADQAFTYDVKQALTANAFERAGYTFAGWNTAADGTGTTYADKAEVENLTADNGGEVTLYAQWTADGSKITYNANGGDGTVAETTGVTDEVVKVADNGFTRTGYTFIGWNTKADGTGTAYDEGADFTLLPTATVLYAQWKANQYTITFDSNGGSAIDPITQDYGTQVTPPANPTREGYTFNGWDKTIPSTMPAENMTITAQWLKNVEVPSGASLEYNGNEQTGVEPGEGYDVSGVSAATDAGTYTAMVTPKAGYCWPDGSREPKTITWTIDKAKLTVTAKDQTYTYNGSAQGEDNAVYTDAGQIAAKVKAVGLKGSDALTSVTLNGRETNAGTYEGKIVPSAVQVGAATNNYEVTYVASKLTINKAKIDPSVSIDDWTYGETSSEPNVDGNAGNGAVTYEYKPKGAPDSAYTTTVPTNVGDYTVRATMAETPNYEGGVATDDFAINKAPAEKPMVEPADDAERHVPDSKTIIATYDGKPHTVNFITDPAIDEEPTRVVYSDDGGKTWKDGTPTLTNAGSTQFIVAVEYPNHETVCSDPWTLTVAPVPISVTTDSASKTYDGRALTAGGNVGGLVDGETVTLRTTGSQTRPGSLRPQQEEGRRRGQGQGPEPGAAAGNRITTSRQSEPTRAGGQQVSRPPAVPGGTTSRQLRDVTDAPARNATTSSTSSWQPPRIQSPTTRAMPAE